MCRAAAAARSRAARPCPLQQRWDDRKRATRRAAPLPPLLPVLMQCIVPARGRLARAHARAASARRWRGPQCDRLRRPLHLRRLRRRAPRDAPAPNQEALLLRHAKVVVVGLHNRIPPFNLAKVRPAACRYLLTCASRSHASSHARRVVSYVHARKGAVQPHERSEALFMLLCAWARAKLYRRDTGGQHWHSVRRSRTARTRS